MSSSSLLSKDKKFRMLFYKKELLIIKFYFYLKCSSNINKFSRYCIVLKFLKNLSWILWSKSRIKIRCLLTGRSRSVFLYFKLSRIIMKNYISYGYMPGIFKTSW